MDFVTAAHSTEKLKFKTLQLLADMMTSMQCRTPRGSTNIITLADIRPIAI